MCEYCQNANKYGSGGASGGYVSTSKRAQSANYFSSDSSGSSRDSVKYKNSTTPGCYRGCNPCTHCRG